MYCRTDGSSMGHKIRPNGNIHRNKNHDPPAREAVERRRVVKEQAENERNKIRENREAFNEQWPEIRVKFEPNVWRETYQKMYSDIIATSIFKLQQVEDLSFEEAEQKLFDILIKATFIELNFMKNGQQTAKTLFDNLEFAVNEEDAMPFESVADLTTFLKSMSPVFIIENNSKIWRNTGTQTRRFCQNLVQRLQLGDAIEDDTFEEVFDEFKKNIVVDDQRQYNFAQNEVLLDISSYCYLASAVPAFKYNKDTGCLSLYSDILPLSLCLPILTETLHARNPKKHDLSRQTTAIVSQYYVSYPTRGTAYGLTQKLNEVDSSIFRVKFVEPPPAIHKHFLSVSGFLAPNSFYEHKEVRELESVRLDFSHNFVANERNKFIMEDNKPSDAKFEHLDKYMKNRKDNTFQHQDLKPWKLCGT